jgi:hypothetical protein
MYYHYYVKLDMVPKAATSEMDIGTICHAMICQDKSLDDVAIEYPESCYTKAKIRTLRSEKAREFREENKNKIVVKNCKAIRNCVEAILTNPLILEVRKSAVKEQRFDAGVADVPCRAKPDIVLDREIVDLKFCEQIDPISFSRSAKNLRYWLQDAHYSAVVGTESFRFLAVEVSPPYRVQEYWYSENSRAAARRFHLSKLADLFRAYRNNDWADRWNPEMSAWLPETTEVWRG